MSEARKRAEEALAKWDSPVARQLHEKHSDAVDCVLALRALLADAPPADAATEAVRNDGVVLADFLHRNALAADACPNCKSDDCECTASPAPAPSADRCATGHDWIRRGEGSCGDRYVCLRCGERKP